MDSNDFKRVEAWLYSIPKTRIAYENLNNRLNSLHKKMNLIPAVQATKYENGKVSGGIKESQQEKWIERMASLLDERQAVLEALNKKRKKLKCFEQVMELLGRENEKYPEIVEKKYIYRIKPDVRIYRSLYLSERHFYRMRRYVVQTFFNCLPGEFIKKVKEG